MRNRVCSIFSSKEKKKKARMNLLFCLEKKLEYFLHKAIRSIKFKRSHI